MNHNLKNPDAPERDRFIFSKGHSVLIQYAALAECGFFPKSILKTTKTLKKNLDTGKKIKKTN